MDSHYLINKLFPSRDSCPSPSGHSNPISLSCKPPESFSHSQSSWISIFPDLSAISEDPNALQDYKFQINNTTDWPFSPHGRLTYKLLERDCLGSGTLIGSQIVLTAARHVYDRGNKVEIDTWTMGFTPAMNGEISPYGECRVLAAFYPEEYKFNPKEDYALLVLDRKIGEDVGFYGMDYIDVEEIVNKPAFIFGYPIRFKDRYIHTDTLWGNCGLVNINSKYDTISYSMETCTGQIGSAVFIQKEGNCYIIGVHSRCIKDKHRKYEGVFFDLSRINRIKTWIQRYCNDTHPTVPQILDIPDSYNTEIPENATVLNYDKNIMGDEGAILLSQSSYDHLYSLSLEFNYLGPKGASALSRGNLSDLAILNISWNNLSNAGIAELSSGNLVNLIHLNLECNRITEEGVIYLASGNLVKLRILNLWGNTIGPIGATELAKGNFRYLKELNLGRNEIKDEGAEGIAKGTLLNIENLNLSNNGITNPGCRVLSKARFIQLKRLDLSRNKIEDGGVQDLTRGNFPSLEEIILSENIITGQGAEYLANGKLNKLIEIDLSMNKIKNKGAKAISKGNFTNLQVLKINWNGIGSLGARALARGNLRELRVLEMNYNRIKSNGARNISEGNFRHLEILGLKHNHIGPYGLSFLLNERLSHLVTLRISENLDKERPYNNASSDEED